MPRVQRVALGRAEVRGCRCPSGPPLCPAHPSWAKSTPSSAVSASAPSSSGRTTSRYRTRRGRADSRRTACRKGGIGGEICPFPVLPVLPVTREKYQAGPFPLLITSFSIPVPILSYLHLVLILQHPHSILFPSHPTMPPCCPYPTPIPFLSLFPSPFCPIPILSCPVLSPSCPHLHLIPMCSPAHSVPSCQFSLPTLSPFISHPRSCPHPIPMFLEGRIHASPAGWRPGGAAAAS